MPRLTQNAIIDGWMFRIHPFLFQLSPTFGSYAVGIAKKGETALIEVSHLTKRYGAHEAVSDLSFTIEKGRITGLLGPNGAGKSTTMNIITGCLGASEGSVRIDGHDVFEEPTQAKRMIGYLPEIPPLYTDMTPEEYLRFVLQAKGVRRSEWDAQLKSVMDRTKLWEVRRRLISSLSKGYRQRVGIAQALLGSPEVIILDEPTVGLDPAQIIEIRELIRELGRDHTIVLSSHILSEVQAVCDHIMIIAHGRLVASDTAENLTGLLTSGMSIGVEVRSDEQSVRALLADMEMIERMTCQSGEEGTVRLTIIPRDNQDIREELFGVFARNSMPLMELHREKATLEDVFLELTQGDSAKEAAVQRVDAVKEDEA